MCKGGNNCKNSGGYNYKDETKGLYCKKFKRNNRILVS